MKLHDEIVRRVRDAVTDADLAFWKVVVERFPEAKTGDFGPEETIAWGEACRYAVTLWVRWNVPGAEQSDALDDSPVRTLGQIAYEAYFASSGGKSLISGAPLPNWSEQSPQIKKAWEAAAAAARESDEIHLDSHL